MFIPITHGNTYSLYLSLSGRSSCVKLWLGSGKKQRAMGYNA